MKTAKDYDWKGSGFEPFPSCKFAMIPIARELWGREWNDDALSFLHAFRPSGISVTTGEVLTVARQWWITVTVNDKGLMTKIEQEARIGML